MALPELALGLAKTAAGLAEITDPTLNPHTPDSKESETQTEIDAGKLVTGFVAEQLGSRLDPESVSWNIHNGVQYSDENAENTWRTRVRDYLVTKKLEQSEVEPNYDQPLSPEDEERERVVGLAGDIINQKVEDGSFPGGEVVGKMTLQTLYTGFGNTIIDAFNEAYETVHQRSEVSDTSNESGIIY